MFISKMWGHGYRIVVKLLLDGGPAIGVDAIVLGDQSKESFVELAVVYTNLEGLGNEFAHVRRKRRGRSQPGSHDASLLQVQAVGLGAFEIPHEPGRAALGSKSGSLTDDGL